MGATAAAVLTLSCFAFVFWPQRHILVRSTKTRRDYLDERKSAVYDNLRDLRFEYQAGKYPEEDYLAQRAALEHEAASILTEIDSLTAIR